LWYGETVLLNNCRDGVKCTDEEHQIDKRVYYYCDRVNGIAILLIKFVRFDTNLEFNDDIKLYYSVIEHVLK
jgi:hypothetical protein